MVLYVIARPEKQAVEIFIRYVLEIASLRSQ